jgi:hypothetical protein
VITAMNIGVPYRAGDFFTSWATINFSSSM